VSADSNGSSTGNPSVKRFFERPILNNPYEYPRRHWELDTEGQPTHRILDGRRPAEFVTPFPSARQQDGAMLVDSIPDCAERSHERFTPADQRASMAAGSSTGAASPR